MPSSPVQHPARRQVLAVVPGPPPGPWVAIVVASWLVASAGGTGIADDDPLEWRPPSRKAQFRKVLTDAEYQRLSAPIASRLPRALREAASRLPDHGLRISGVFEPGALEAQGVGSNDVITEVDGEELWGRYGKTRDEPVRVRVYSAGGTISATLEVLTK